MAESETDKLNPRVTRPIEDDLDPDPWDIDELDEDHRHSAHSKGDTVTGVPDLLRRAIAVGLSGFFTTETALRRALGDTIPKDWVDFAAEQSERTQKELFDRLSGEFGRVLEGVDLVQFAEALLEGRTVEINASFRLGPKDGEPKPGAVKKRVRIHVDSNTDDSDTDDSDI